MGLETEYDILSAIIELLYSPIKSLKNKRKRGAKRTASFVLIASTKVLFDICRHKLIIRLSKKLQLTALEMGGKQLDLAL